MIVMVSNQTGIEIGLLAAKYPGKVGHMFSPGGERGPWNELPYACDNDAWPAYKNKRPRDIAGHRRLLYWSLMSGISPTFALVPDVVADRESTLREWDENHSWMSGLGFRLGFAAQDGMTFGDVPTADCVVFIGGSSKWKDQSITPWCRNFPGRVHVGRVNGMPRLLSAYHSGAISIDGTGWFHKGTNQRNDLRNFLRETNENAL